MRLIHLVHNRGSLSHEVSCGVDVVVRDEQQVSGPRAEGDLVFEGHDHQLVQLQERDNQGVELCLLPP